MKTFWIPGRLPGQNDVVKSLNQPGGRHQYNERKARWQGMIAMQAEEQGFCVVGDCWGYLFVESNRKRDPSNVMAGAIKLVEDALQECGMLENDGWEQVMDIKPYFELYAAEPGVLVANSEGEIGKGALLAEWGKL